MAKKLVKRDDRVVRFFGKWRKLGDRGEFKIGRMRVLVVMREPDSRWYADLSGYDDAVTIAVVGARSRAAALKQLERRIELLQRALDNLAGKSW